jgi:hypothetical protein
MKYDDVKKSIFFVIFKYKDQITEEEEEKEEEGKDNFD